MDIASLVPGVAAPALFIELLDWSPCDWVVLWAAAGSATSTRASRILSAGFCFFIGKSPYKKDLISVRCGYPRLCCPALRPGRSIGGAETAFAEIEPDRGGSDDLVYL